MCKCSGVLGGDIGNHVQGDQRLGLCHHLAHRDPPDGGGHHLAVAEDSTACAKVTVSREGFRLGKLGEEKSNSTHEGD